MISEFRINEMENELKSIEEKGMLGVRRILSGPQGPQAILDGKDTIILTSTNYLGLSSNPDLIAESTKALVEYGGGLSSGPRICGVTDLHLEFEDYIAKFNKTEGALLYSSCYNANIGVLTALADKNDVIFSDELNHASIVDGCRLSSAKIEVYPHLDLDYLKKKLESTADYGKRLIITDGVFSMDGDIAPIPQLIEIAREFDAILIVDDAHATGVIGEHGRGTAELFGVLGEIDIITSTLGKAMGGTIGGYVAGNSILIKYLIQKSRNYRYTNVVPSSSTAYSFAAFKYLEKHQNLLNDLKDNTNYFKNRLLSLGFEVMDSKTPIVPVMVRDPKTATAMSKELLKRGVFVQSYTYPVVPHGHERLRCIISAAHKKEQLDRATQIFEVVGKEIGAI